MKKLFSVFLVALLLLSLSSLCLAAPEELSDEIIDDSSEGQIEDLSMDLIINDSVSGQHVIDSLISALSARSSDPEPVSDELQLVDVTLMSVSPVTPSDTSGLKAALLSVLGDYDPVIVEYRYQNINNTSYSYLREIQPDYVWLCSAAILLVVLFCIFKLGGAALSKR